MAARHLKTRVFPLLAMAAIIVSGVAYFVRSRSVPTPPVAERAVPAELPPEWKAVATELAKKVRTAQTTPYHGMTFVEADAVHWVKRRVWDTDAYQYRQHALRFFGSLPREAQSDVLHGNMVYVSMDTNEDVWNVPYGAGSSVAYYRAQWQDPSDAKKQHYAIIADAISGDTWDYDWLFIPIADHIAVGSDHGRQKRLLDAVKTMHETYLAKGDLDLNDIASLGEFNEFDLQAVSEMPSISPQSKDYPWLKLQTGREITFYSLLSPDQRLRALSGNVLTSTLTPDQRDALALVVIDRSRLERAGYDRPVGVYAQSRRIDAESHVFDPVSFAISDKGIVDTYYVMGDVRVSDSYYESYENHIGIDRHRLSTAMEAYALPLARKANPNASAADVIRQRTHKYEFKVGVTGGYTYTTPLDVTTNATLEDIWRLRKTTP